MPPKIVFNDNEINIPLKFFNICNKKVAYSTLAHHYILLTKPLKRDLSDLSASITNEKKKTHTLPLLPSFLNQYNLHNSQIILIVTNYKHYLNEHLLHEFHFSEVVVSLFDCIRLFFIDKLNIRYTIDDIKNIIHRYFLTHLIDTVPVDNYFQIVKSFINSFISTKNYNEHFVIHMINNIANIFSICFFIIHVKDECVIEKCEFLKPTNNIYEEHIIILSRHKYLTNNKIDSIHFNIIYAKKDVLKYYLNTRTHDFRPYVNYNIKSNNNNNESDFEDSNSEISSESDNENDPIIKTCTCKLKSQLCKHHGHLNSNNKYNKNQLNFLNVAKSIYKQDCLNNRHSVGEIKDLLVCYNCKALLFIGENTGSKLKPCSNVCCMDGKIYLPEKKSPPKYICDLLRNNDKDSNDFKINIRAYNQCLSFTSLGVNLDKRYANNLKGHYNYRIHGTTYHRIGSLLPDKHKNPAFAQLYIYDTANELNNRLKIFPTLNNTIISKLQDLMHSHNPYVKIFKQFAFDTLSLPNLNLRLRADSTIDRKVTNLPACSEIAAILPGKLFT